MSDDVERDLRSERKRDRIILGRDLTEDQVVEALIAFVEQSLGRPAADVERETPAHGRLFEA